MEIREDDDGDLRIRTKADLKLRSGDVVSVIGTSNYNDAHRVKQVLGNREFTVRTTHVADEVGAGQVFLDIPDEEYELYRVMPQLSGNGEVSTFDSRVFVNRDPRGEHGIGVIRRIYLSFEENGDYRVSLAADLDVAGEG